MPKIGYERLAATLDQIVDREWSVALFSGFRTDVVRSIVIGDLNHHWAAAEKTELNELLSLGGIRIVKMDATTKERHLKRMTLLFHRVPGYHAHAETAQLRDTILNQSRAQVLPRSKYEIARALKYIQDEELWSKDVALRHAGVLKHYYNQGKDNRLKQIDITEDGWCLGMAVHWLGCKAQKMEFWGTHLSELGAGKYRFIMAAQGVRVAQKNFDDRWSFRLSKFGLKRTSKTEETANPTAQRLASMITACAGTHCTITQYYSTGGGHAMAACFENGGVSFLDPNLGEFWFKTRSGFEDWFPLFVRKMNYRFRKFSVEDYSTGQAPVSDYLKDALSGRRAAMGYDD